MGVSFIREALLAAHLPRQSWTTLISRVGFSIGFLIVVLGRQQLFTENTLTEILPLMLRKDSRTFRSGPEAVGGRSIGEPSWHLSVRFGEDRPLR